MSNETIDRVAQVLCDLDGAYWLADQGWYRDRARLVMTAMRKPDAAMIAAGVEEVGYPDDFTPEDVVERVFTAAIDAALATRSTST